MQNLGLISDPSKVKHDKSGQISFLDVGAIKGAELFQERPVLWMEQVLVPQLKSKGITKEGDIIDAMGSIFTNRTASNLFAQMYMQREQIHKNAKLNAGADDIDQLNSKAMGTTTGKEIEAKITTCMMLISSLVLLFYPFTPVPLKQQQLHFKALMAGWHCGHWAG